MIIYIQKKYQIQISLIRTGNTNRLSNFLLWQIAYTEIFFIKKFWPEFSKDDYKRILKKFRLLKRNFGSI